MSTRPDLTPAQIEALEARFALRVSARLDEGARSLPHDLSERLRVARLQALAAGRRSLAPVASGAVRTAPATTSGGVLAGAGQRGTAGGPSPAAAFFHGDRGPDDGSGSWGWRLAAALPALALILGLWGIGTWQQRQRAQAAVEVDTALLTDTLPPAAYADPGFEEFLRGAASLSGVSAQPGVPQEAVPPGLAPDAGPAQGVLPPSPQAIPT